MTRRFWLETGISALTLVLAIFTLISRDWIEALFGTDPDNHSGSLEWLIVAGLVIVSLVTAWLARAQWRGGAAASSRAG